MSSAIPPNPWFSTINFNENFFPANTQTISLSYANASYLKRIGVATSVASLTTFNGAVGVNGALSTNGLINATTANFSGEVNFNSIVSPPHCAILPSNENDLCNKLYVDSQAALTAYQLYLNYSATFTTPAPASVAYKTLSQTQVPTPSTVPFTISAIGSQQIAGFFNTLVAINIPTTIPAGVWTLLCFSNVNTIADQAHIGIQYTISSFNASGAETLVYTSPVSALLSVVSPLIGTSSVSGTFPATTLAVGSTGIGLKLFITSNTGATRTGNIFFQNSAEYSSILTSFAVQQAPDLLNLPNIWTNTNAFNNTTPGALSSAANATLAGVSVGKGIGGGTNNIVVGYNNMIAGSNGGNNITIGKDCMTSSATGACANNIAMGNTALTAITSGTTNVAIGSFSTTSMTTASNNVGVGYATSYSLTTGANNTSVGTSAGFLLTTGSNNTSVGSTTNQVVTTGSGNTSIGYNAGADTGGENYSNSTAIGFGAKYTTANQIMLGTVSETVRCPNTLTTNSTINGMTVSNKLGLSGVVVVGASAGNALTTATGTVLVGGSAGVLVTTGSGNSGIGTLAFDKLVSGTNNTAVGTRAGTVLTTGNRNTNIGGMTSITTNVSTTGADNTTVGFDARCSADGLTFATAIGSGAVVGTSNTIVLGKSDGTVSCPNTLTTTGAINGLTVSNKGGVNNVVIGNNAGAVLTGVGTVIIGGVAGTLVSSGTDNTCVGTAAFGALTTGGGNTALGRSAGSILTTGSRNTNIGGLSISNVNTTGSNNSTLGYNTICSVDALTFATAIGAGAVVGTSNTIVLGKSDGNVICPGTITHNGNTTLPTVYAAVPATTQLGGLSTIVFTAAQAITSNVIKRVGSITLPAGGTYIVNMGVTFNSTSTQTITRYVAEVSASDAAFVNNVSQNTQYGSWSLINTNSNTFNCAMTFAVTTSTVIYGNLLVTFPVTGTCGGSMSYTRIA